MKVIFLEAYLFYLQKAFDTVDHNMLLKAKSLWNERNQINGFNHI